MSALTIGLDIGGTKIAGGVVDSTGRIVVEGRRATPSSSADSITTASAGLITELRDRAAGEVVGVGVACAGFVDVTGSMVMFAPNLAWRDEPFRARLEERTGMNVILENDANAAAWGEFRHGAARAATSMVMVTVGTGIGGGIVSDGRLLRGAHGMGAEIGHMRVVPQGNRCGCGNRGCWEAYAAGTALVRQARELVASASPLAAALIEKCHGDPEALEGHHVTEAAVAGDAAAIELIAEIGTWVGEGMASIAAILDPEMLVVGGGVVAAGELLMEPARRGFGRQLTGRGHRPDTPVVMAELGNRAGVIGAAALAAEIAGATDVSGAVAT